jgi:hypothetical protein
MRNLRGNRSKLIEQILKKEDSLLKSDFPDYFKDMKDPVQSKGEEPSDESSYKAETEVEDSFDEDFEEEEDDVSSDELKSQNDQQTSENMNKKSKPKSKIITSFKNKKDKYFKKGFDIKQLNFDILVTEAQQKPEKTKKIRKSGADLSKMKHNFLHEAFPQNVLLKNALTIEKINLSSSDWMTGNINPSAIDPANSSFLKNVKTFDYRKNVKMDPISHESRTVLLFPDTTKLEKYFKEILEIPTDEHVHLAASNDTNMKFSSIEEYKAKNLDLEQKCKNETNKDHAFCYSLLQNLEEKRSKVKIIN